jgi:hypothetical protein
VCIIKKVIMGGLTKEFLLSSSDGILGRCFDHMMMIRR